jgi:uncharacterized membrane protein YesL
MKLKKIDFTKIIVKGTEWFSSLAVLNLSWLLFSLPIVTVIPATDAVFEVIHNWELTGKRGSVFQQFKEAFKNNFKSSYKLGLPIVLAVVLIVLDSYFLNHLTITSGWFQVLKYGFYTFFLLIILSILYAYPLMKNTGENHIRIFVMALFVAIGHPLTTLGVIGSLLIMLFIFLLWPGMVFFFGISGTAYIMTKAVSHILSKSQEEQKT